MRIYNMLFTMSFIILFNGCAMRTLHNKTIVNLRNETAHNYSKQVVEAAAGILDRSELPVMFSVEGGNSTWNPHYEKSFNFDVSPPWSAATTVLSPGILASESVVDTVQINDFGSDATYRLNNLFSYVCFPFVIENLVLPNGMLYSIFNIQNTQEGLDYPTKLSHGKYIGVPLEKRKEFLLFVSDVLNWSRHASPDILDLSSPPGIAYMFFFKYYHNLQDSYSSIQASTGLNNEIQQYEIKNQIVTLEYETKLHSALNGDSISNGFPAILKLLQSHVEGIQSSLNDLENELNSSRTTGQKYYIENHFILKNLTKVLTTLAKQDPDINVNQVNETLLILQQRIDDVHEGKLDDIMKELKLYIPVGGSGIEAAESTEDLYRERFERLPDVIDTSSIRLN